MEPREFIRKVIELYREARKPRFYHPSINRGLSRAISRLTEDLLSYFLAVNLTEDYDLFTDQNITFSSGIKTIRPDTVVVKNNVMEHIIDIKTESPFPTCFAIVPPTPIISSSGCAAIINILILFKN